MNNPLESMSPAQRKVLAYGAAGVVGVVAFNKVTGRSSEPPVVLAAPTVTPIQPMPSTDAIGVGELGDYFSAFTDGLTELMERVDTLENPPTSPEPAPDPGDSKPTTMPTPVAVDEDAADRQAMEQRVRDLFARYNVAPSYTYAPTGETPDQRIARLAREQMTGDRSWEALQRSVALLGDVSAGRRPAPT